jgi:hypothetical protein
MTTTSVVSLRNIHVFEDWLAERFGSSEAAHAEFARFAAMDDYCYRDAMAQLELQWQLAVCENAGIPYDGWQTYAGFCATERFKANENEEEGIRIIHAPNADPTRKTAFQWWMQKMSGWNNYGPYGFHPNADPNAYDHSEP